MLKQTGDFGKLAKQYSAARSAYPSAVMRLIRKNISGREPKVLDIGCGTGISTRQLAKSGLLAIGSDVDLGMINQALAEKGNNVSYTVATADKIPFTDRSFSAVTAFTSFHWFTTTRALKEIRRVLKPDGVFCIVQPREVAPFAELREIVESFLKRPAPARYSMQDFGTVLTKAGFQWESQYFKTVTTYTLEKYLVLLQSYSIWNQVPPGRRAPLLAHLRRHYAAHLKDGRLHVIRKMEVIIAKPK